MFLIGVTEAAENTESEALLVFFLFQNIFHAHLGPFPSQGKLKRDFLDFVTEKTGLFIEETTMPHRWKIDNFNAANIEDH